MRELSLSQAREDQSLVTEATKTGKKRQGESNEQEKIKKIRPSKEVFNKYASQNYSLEFDRESQSV